MTSSKGSRKEIYFSTQNMKMTSLRVEKRDRLLVAFFSIRYIKVYV